MDQPLLAATPLPVAARARIDVRAEAIMDRSWGLGGRRNGRGTFLCRRSRSKEDVAVGGAEGWVVVGIGVLKCGGVVAPAEQLPSPAGGAAGEEGRGVGGERGGGADEGGGREAGWWSPVPEWSAARVGRGDLGRGYAREPSYLQSQKSFASSRFHNSFTTESVAQALEDKFFKFDIKFLSRWKMELCGV
jgi:hypothetical protein